MKKKKNNIVSEEIISEEDLYEEPDENIPETPIQKKSKGKIFASIFIILLLVIIIGVLAFFVMQKYSGNNSNNPSNGVVEEEPSSPYIDVSPSPTAQATSTPIPTEEPVTETPEPTETPEVTTIPEVPDDSKDSLDLEESSNNSLNLEEVDNEKDNIDEKYKDITVYYTENLKTFHTKDCPTIKDKDKIKTTAYSALENGYEECSSCNPLNSSSLKDLSDSDLKLLEEIEVYKTASNTKYHTKDCSILKNTGIKISLKDAIENNLDPCSLCNPKTLSNFKDTNDSKNNSSTSGNKSDSKTDNSSKITPTSKPNNTNNSNSSNNNKTTPTPTTVITPTVISIPVTSLSITGGTVKVGENLQLYVSFAPVNAVSTLTYTTSNSNIAKISSSGIVTGISTGTVTISISAPNGVYASSIVTVVAKDVTPTVTPTTTPTPTQVPTQKPTYTDTTLDINNLGLTGISKFVYPSNINLIDMEAMSDWQAFAYKISSNGGEVITTSTSVTLNVGGVTRLQLSKYNDNVWSLRVYDDLNTTLNKCTLKAMCTKISSMPDTIYSNIYDDYEVSEFIGERYRSIGDASIKSEISGGSTTYYIKDVNYEY